MLVARLVSRIHFEAPVTIVHHPVTSQPSSNHVVQSCKCTFIIWEILCYSATNKDAKSQKKLNTYIWNVHLFVIKNYVHWASAFLNHLAGCFLPKMKKNVKFFWPCQWANFYGVRLFWKIVNISFNFSCHFCQLWQLRRQNCDFLWIEFYVQFILLFKDCSCK